MCGKFIKMQLFIVALLLISSWSSSSGQTNETLPARIARALQSENEIVQSYSTPDFLFNSCNVPKYKPTKEIANLLPYYLSGFDQEGRPVWVGEFGKFDLKRMTSRGEEGLAELDSYNRDVVFNFIRSLFQQKTAGRPTFQFIFILDLEGLRESQVTVENIQYMRKLCKQFIRLINEYAYAMVIINVNSVALKLTDVFRPIFEDSMDKLEIFGENKEEWLAYLKKVIPADQLPPWYGGNEGFKPFRVYPVVN